MEEGKIIDEPKVEFRSISDRSVFNVINEDTGVVLVEISGYDLQINFNMEHINSVEEVEAAVSGLGELFRQSILEELLKHNKPKE